MTFISVGLLAFNEILIILIPGKHSVVKILPCEKGKELILVDSFIFVGIGILENLISECLGICVDVCQHLLNAATRHQPSQTSTPSTHLTASEKYSWLISGMAASMSRAATRLLSDPSDRFSTQDTHQKDLPSIQDAILSHQCSNFQAKYRFERPHPCRRCSICVLHAVAVPR